MRRSFMPKPRSLNEYPDCNRGAEVIWMKACVIVNLQHLYLAISGYLGFMLIVLHTER